MILFAIVLGTILFWASTNVCRYNFAIEKKTKEFNLIVEDIDPSIANAKVYYYTELNCNDINLSWDYERVIENLKIISVILYQELSTDIKGEPN
ncbi:hypothetical protein [Candidatus Pelagibacter sp.]|uniref:hypothetical protein n=1 Tax=Candidatus Pelagibacter sp. TaxID=2024849 RepID=UPI003F841308|tara:strand:+ start:234 stop:515 length:282 start_codon:yes stop_codon:yes gene_type:complete